MDNVVNNLSYIVKDLLYGDNSVVNRKEYIETTQEEISRASNLILNNTNLSEEQKKYFIDNVWRINYKIRPPSMEEFLTPAWIGTVADTLYDHVKETLIKFTNPLSKKRVLALSTCIGWGKSSLSSILAVYIIVLLSYMHNPKAYFNLNEMGPIVVALMSFTLQKVNQVLLHPFNGLLKASPIFHRTVREDRLQKKQSEIKPYEIAYTSAGRMGAFQFARDIHITVASSRNDILGLNIVLGIVSEISFFMNKGIPLDEIWGAFSDMRERVNNRFAHKYPSGVILDSSPLDLSISPIDKWIYEGDAIEDSEVMIVHAKHWDVFSEKYPKWKKTGKTIPVFRGDAGRPPKQITAFNDDEFTQQEIIQFPIDTEQSLKNPGELKKIVADLAGWPAGGILKLIENKKDLEQIFTDKLNNLYTSIDAPEDSEPEDLIWNKVKDIFFVQSGNKWEFYRTPNALRTLHIDLAESGDMASISMNHIELYKDSNIIVNDFVINVSPKKSRINLDAICSFILALKNRAHIHFHKITADQYQSSALLQRLKRYDIEIDKLSVDRETTPYRVVVSWILNGKVRCGKNIFLKNNFLSLQEIINDKGKKKIDHTKGRIVYEDHGDWNTSLMGINAKDSSDAFTGSAYVLISELDQKIPKYIWREQQINSENGIDESILKDINKKFKVKVS